MHIKIYTLLLTSLLVGCDNKSKPTISKYIEDVVDCSKVREQQASFINQCITNANPKSDEEPEDWIRSCEKMSERLCERSRWTVFKTKQVNDGAYRWLETKREPYILPGKENNLY